MSYNAVTVSPAILGLLRCMPVGGLAGFSTWAKKDKDRWMEAFKAVIDMEYPDPQEESTQAEGKQP